ncbi:MAG: hypothetical protein KDD82_26130 [Planctomycetes bacterium]|nr:hypothetical protein [Planctomycetota bacterium]
MSDRRLRELERSCADDRDEARFLWGRLRAGELNESRLELAAYAGHPSAQLVLGVDDALAERELGDWAAFHAWVWGLGPYGQIPEALAAAAVARLALRGAWLAAAPVCDDELPRRTVERVEDWLRTEERAAASQALAAFDAFGRALSADELAREARGLFWLCHDALEAALSSTDEGRPCRQRVYRAVEREGRASERFGVARTSEQIASALIAWALRPPTTRCG